MRETCSRCTSPVVDPQACWWCHGDLCAPCWEEHGHCGHPEAEALNELGRAAVVTAEAAPR